MWIVTTDIVHFTHQAKVTELEEGWLCACDEHVGGLDVPVHHLTGVAEGNG